MNTITWERPSGELIETNDLPANIAHAESLEWRRLSEDELEEEEE